MKSSTVIATASALFGYGYLHALVGPNPHPGWFVVGFVTLGGVLLAEILEQA
jgi:hypothetical protein